MSAALVILDIMLPGEDGVSLLKKIKASSRTGDIPVIMATAKSVEYDKIKSLDMGADDYLVKPFGMMEMVSRIKAVLRRCMPKKENKTVYVNGIIEMNVEEHTVSVSGESICLTYKEYEILKIFLMHPGMAYTRNRLLSEVWGIDSYGESRTVDMHIKTLRQKLGDGGRYIVTVRNVGYTMTKKIFKSVLLVAVVMVLFCCTFILGILYRHFTTIEEEQLGAQLGFVVTGVENGGVDYLKSLTEKKYRITWVEPDGTVKFDNKTDASKMENHANREEIKESLKFGRGECTRYSSTLTQRTIYYAKKINDGSIIRISVSQETVLKLLFSMISPMAITILLAVILSSLLARGVSKKVVEPLNNLDLNKPLQNDAYGEIAPLLRHIEHQHRQIDEQVLELRQKKDEFQATIENMDEGLILLDAKNSIISINPAAKKIFGTTDECLGKDFLTVERNTSVGNTIKEAMEKGKAEIILKRYGLDYQLGISKIESAGKTLGAVLLAVDVTEKNNAERTRREFSANVSHELKTPLQSIIGSAELMENNLVKEEDMPRFVGHIRKEAERLVNLVEDIIRLSWLDENRDIETELVSLKDIAAETKEALENTANEKNVTINISGEDIKLHGVRSLLYEIVYNLCENGIKYNKEGGKVDITLSKEAGKDILVVEDTGIGIKEDQQSRIFERFYRVDKSRSKETGGTGLGLSIVKHAAMYHNADVTLESTEGQGSKFTVMFPRE